MHHTFDIEHAAKYGIEEAILISNFQYWIGHNKANRTHQYADRTWTYNSVKAFAELFPYMSAPRIRRTLESLVKQGVLLEGNYNASTYDRTKWYAFFDESIFLNGQIHLTKSANGIADSGKTDTNINTDRKTDRKPNTSADALDDGYPEDFEQAWSAYPDRPGDNKAKAFKAWKARIAEGKSADEILKGVGAYARYVFALKTEPRYIKQAATFFGPDHHYRSKWTIPPEAETTAERNARIRAEFLGEQQIDDGMTIDMEAA